MKRKVVMNKPTFIVSDDKKTLTVKRRFDVPVSKVWNAWTTQEIMEQWWAPKPWLARTVSYDFREGGHWHYYMEGPKGERHYCWTDYDEIKKEEFFKGFDGFCDEDGNKNADLPGSIWSTRFIADGDKTKVVVKMKFATPKELEQNMEMGFKEGFTQGLKQLEELLSKEV